MERVVETRGTVTAKQTVYRSNGMYYYSVLQVNTCCQNYAKIITTNVSDKYQILHSK